MLIGRSAEIQTLSELYNQKRSTIVVLYGRRRIGKSFLIENYISKLPHLKFEGIENQPSTYQITLLDKAIRSSLSFY